MCCDQHICHAELNLLMTRLLFWELAYGVATPTFRNSYFGLCGEAFHCVVTELLLFHCLKEHGTIVAMARMLYSPPPRKVGQITACWDRVWCCLILGSG